jgi:hypothetical protein
LPSARTSVSIHQYEHYRFSYRGLSPHKFTPMPGVHNWLDQMANKLGGFLKVGAATGQPRR